MKVTIQATDDDDNHLASFEWQDGGESVIDGMPSPAVIEIKEATVYAIGRYVITLSVQRQGSR